MTSVFEPLPSSTAGTGGGVGEVGGRWWGRVVEGVQGAWWGGVGVG